MECKLLLNVKTVLLFRVYECFIVNIEPTHIDTRHIEHKVRRVMSLHSVNTELINYIHEYK